MSPAYALFGERRCCNRALISDFVVGVFNGSMFSYHSTGPSPITHWFIKVNASMARVTFEACPQRLDFGGI